MRYDYSLSSNNAEFYVNGVAAGTLTKTGNSVSSTDCMEMFVGMNNISYTTEAAQGYLSDLQISNVWKPFTVPTQPFIADPHTKLLLHMDGSGQAFYDASDDPGTMDSHYSSTEVSLLL